MIHLDTHVLVWLLTDQRTRLPAGVRQLLESQQLVISPMVELELTYLHEIGRITRPADEVLAAVRPALGLNVSSAPFSSVVAAAAAVTWTSDPFDRLIAGASLADRCDLLTADETMRRHLPSARWPD